MQVAMYYKNNDIRLEEMPVPEIGVDEVLLQVEASGICGSDVMEWYRINKVPLVLGHELAGIITKVGKKVKDYKVGDRVVVAHHVPCDECYYCRNGHHTICDTLRKTKLDPGGFCEQVRIPAINVSKGLFKIPSHVSFEEASFTEPIACVLRALHISGFKAGMSVLVLGNGIIGVLCTHLAKVLGAELVFATDIVPYRLETAKKFGADYVLDARNDIPLKLKEVNNGRLADLVIVCAGAKSAQEQALFCVERGGTVMFFAPTDPGLTIPVSINDLFFSYESIPF